MGFGVHPALATCGHIAAPLLGEFGAAHWHMASGTYRVKLPRSLADIQTRGAYAAARIRRRHVEPVYAFLWPLRFGGTGAAGDSGGVMHCPARKPARRDILSCTGGH